MTLLELLLNLPTPARPEPPPGHAADPATEALELLQRLKCYTLPSGRMPAARRIVRRLEPLLAKRDFDLCEALGILRNVESELLALGGAPDPELAGAVEMVRQVFPGARLVEIKLQ